MATLFAVRHGRTRWNLCMGALVLGLTLGSGVTHAQDFLAQPPRARQLLKSGRELYAKGDYEAASQAYDQVEAAKESLTATEQQDLAAQMKQNSTALKARRDGLGLLDQADKALAAGKSADAESYIRLAQANQFLAPTDKQRLSAMTQGLGQLRVAQKDIDGKTDPASMMARAREALKKGDLDSAETLAKQAEKSRSMVSGLMFWNDTPARILADIQTARAKAPKTIENRPGEFTLPGTKSTREYPPTTANDNTSDPATVTNYSPNSTSTNPADRAKAKAQARQLVMDGYKALESNDLAKAGTLANQARDMRPDLEWWEPNPDKLLSDIQRRTAANQVTAGGGDARATLRQARGYFLQQRYDEAEKLATQAETLPNNRFGLFEDSPKKLRDEIVRARGQMDIEKANKLTVEARKALKQNNVAEAKTLASQAKQLQGQNSTFWNWNDTPDAVLRDVARLEKANPNLAQPSPFAPPALPDIAQASGTQPKANDSLESAQIKMQAKSRAITLLVEARNLEKQGHLVEARAKATQAQHLFTLWSPNEESPAIVLRDLDSRAGARIKQLLDQATDTVLKNPTDSTRFQKADNYLVNARRLAESFRQDTTPIDQKIQWLQQVASQSQISPIAAQGLQSVQALKNTAFEEPSEPGAKAAFNDGQEKLEQARRELRAGNTVMSRRYAEEAFASPALREEAQKVLRSIDAEDHNQTILAAQRNYEAGMDAFRNRDYRKAGNMLSSVDVRLLKPDQARRVGEVIESSELRGGLQLASGTQPVNGSKDSAPIGKSTVSDLGDDPHLSAVREMRKVEADKYRQLSLSAQQRAQSLAKNGQDEKAVEALQDFLLQLKGSTLDTEGLDRLSRPIDDRIQKLRTAMAQKEIERQQKVASGQKHNEVDLTVKKMKTQEKVAQLVNRGGQKMKEGKFDEALVDARLAQDLDPDNIAAQALIFVVTTKKNESDYNRHKAQGEGQFIDYLNNDPGEMATSRDPVKGNKELMARNVQVRKDFSVQQLIKGTPKEQAIERKLSQPITLNFQDAPLYRVLQDLQILSGVNIVPDKAAMQAEGISLEQPLSLNVDNISLKSALNLLLKQAKLTYVIKNEVLEITTEANAKGKRRMVTYSIADLVVPVDDHGTSSVNSFEEALKRHISTTGGGVNYQSPTPYNGPFSLQNGTPVSQGGQAGGSGGANTWQTNKQPQSNVSHTIEHLVINLITNTISPDSWESTGGEGRIQYFPLGHALVVSQVQEVQEEVQALLNALRRLQDIQISIEMRIVSVSEKFFERIGMDFDVNIRTPTYRVENQLLNGSYAPFNQVNRNLGVNNVVTGYNSAGQLTPDLNVPIKASSFDFSVPPFGGFPGTLGADGGLSLGLAFLSDIQVFMFLEAAQGDQRTHIMQAPKITVFNGQTANIQVQDQMFFLTGVSIAQAGSQTFFVPQNQPFPVGVGMQVTPVVSADRRFVRLNLVPQLTNLVSANIPLIPVQIPIPQLFDGPNGQGVISSQPVIFQMFFQQPSFTTINLNTTVNVPDGGTVLLGGMKTLAEGRNEFGPPILSKIPYISRLFRNQAFGREAQSIMVMVTPRIIINEEIEQEILGQIAPIPR